MTRKFDITVIGEINADLIISGNVVPLFNQTEQIVESANLVLGSSAVIFASGCAKLGLSVVYLGKVGNDLFGTFMLDSMRAIGIDTSGVVVDPNIGTGLSIILADKNDRAILTYPGTISELVYDEIDMALIKQSRHLHLSGFYLLDKLRPQIPTLFAYAKNSGMSTSLDTNYDPSETWDGGLLETLNFVDVFLPNEVEAKKITNQKTAQEALLSLTETVDCVAIKQGASGATGKNRISKVIQQNAFPVELVDTVGAGDSFDAGFVYGYLQGWTIEENLKIGVACGTLSTLKSGGTAGQANHDLAREFINTCLNERR